MSTRDIAYDIFNRLSEEQLQGFIQMFGRFYPAKQSETEKKMEAFAALEALRQPMEIDEKAELDAWRKEKYGL